MNKAQLRFMDELSFWDRLILRKTKQNRSRHKYAFVPYQQIKHISLVADSDRDIDLGQVHRAVERLKKDGKHVDLILLTKKKQQQPQPHIIRYRRFLGNVRFDSQHDKNSNVKYDLVIGYDTERNMVLEYFLSTLNTTQVAMPYFSDDTQADILIKTNAGSPEGFVEQIINFLTIIKTR